jgi:hypothetical protein
MPTQWTGTRRRAGLGAALVALALAVAVIVLATQAISVRSTRVAPQVRSVPAHLAPSANPGVRTSSHITDGCWRRKYGCQHRRKPGSDITVGCRRPKYGCQQGANTTANLP